MFDTVFADIKFAGIDGVELTHQALRHAEILDDAGRVVERLAALGGRTFGVTAEPAPAAQTPGQRDAQLGY